MINNLHSFKVIFVATVVLLLFSANSFSQWINEIHYDNGGADSGEAVEIAGPAGTDLSCFQLVLYNGTGGAVYSTIVLSGIIDDEGCGFGALTFSIAGIQNGAPDGIALESLGGGGCPAAGLIQFLSYEGSFAGVGGIANGVTSTDIGVSEAGSLANSSLQLVGAGSTYGSFSWQAEGPVPSFGSLNVGQSISPCGANTITTGTITGAPFAVDCNVPATDAGSVDFTSVGTFNVGNIYTAQLSDASGSFASPTAIGTLASTANSGTINFTIPATLTTGSGYLIRIISDNPATTGSSSASFTITQSGSCGPALTSAGVIINEWSNGAIGNEEYYEFVVAGECGTLVDIRGYILDDNNGTFTNPADYSGTSSGIAPGHFRFSNVAQWASIPVGSLILIYNNEEPNPSLPAADPTDSNNDSLYVVPHDNALFERCTTMPGSNSPDSLYTPCAYATAPLTGWGPLSLRNGGDAIQVRSPNGDYYHGVSYGGTEITGGPHNLKLITGAGTGMCGWFSDGDFFDIANWDSGAVAGNETPGVANNAANAAWLIAMRDTTAMNCPFTVLPVELILFTGENEYDGNVLRWKTASETNSAYFTIERSINGMNWEVITTMVSVGNTTSLSNYSFIDNRFEPAVNYYRLSQTDFDGATKVYHEYVAVDNTLENSINLVRIINLLGQEIDRNQPGIQIHIYDDGTSKKFFKD